MWNGHQERYEWWHQPCVCNSSNNSAMCDTKIRYFTFQFNWIWNRICSGLNKAIFSIEWSNVGNNHWRWYTFVYSIFLSHTHFPFEIGETSKIIIIVIKS